MHLPPSFRMKNYVIYRVACTIQLLLFFFFAVFSFHPRSYDRAHATLPAHPHVYELPVTSGEPPIPSGLNTTKTYAFTRTPPASLSRGDTWHALLTIPPLVPRGRYGFTMTEAEWGLDIPSNFNL